MLCSNEDHWDNYCILETGSDGKEEKRTEKIYWKQQCSCFSDPKLQPNFGCSSIININLIFESGWYHSEFSI